MGAISMALTLVNIGGIILGAIVLFYIKETAPLPSRGALFGEITKGLRDAGKRFSAVRPAGEPTALIDVCRPLDIVTTPSGTPAMSPSFLSTPGVTFQSVAARRFRAGLARTSSTQMSLADAIETLQAAQVQPSPARPHELRSRQEEHLKIATGIDDDA
jgi:hypothetical protein